MDYSKTVDRLIARQLRDWDEAGRNYAALDSVATRMLDLGQSIVQLQYNPERRRSTAASLDKQSIARRQCYLCGKYQPAKQRVLMPYIARKLQAVDQPVFSMVFFNQSPGPVLAPVVNKQKKALLRQLPFFDQAVHQLRQLSDRIRELRKIFYPDKVLSVNHPCRREILILSGENADDGNPFCPEAPNFLRRIRQRPDPVIADSDIAFIFSNFGYIQRLDIG